MIVMKCGGTSVKDAERIRAVIEIIRSNLKEKPVMVFSAMGKVTDLLIESGEKALRHEIVDISEIRRVHRAAVQELSIEPDTVEPLLSDLENLLRGIALIGELSIRTRDLLVSFGERLSVRVITASLNKAGIPARYYDAWDAGFITNSEFQNASLLPQAFDRIRAALSPVVAEYAFTPVITGFIGKDEKGHVTTLGRGGSDLTASVLGNALDAEEVQVWKDVDGLLTTDPKVIPEARIVEEISFEEASELAYFGAKILHPQSILPAMEKNIPVRVKNSYRPLSPGTVIRKDAPSLSPVKVITFQRHVTLIDIVSTRMLGLHGFLARVFQVFARHAVSVDMIASSEISISLTLNRNGGSAETLGKLSDELREFAHVSVRPEKGIVTVVGDVTHSSLVLAEIMSLLVKLGIRVQMISQGASKVNISFIVDSDEVETVVRSLHRHFFNK
ncbi:MAG: aspartate kinase [Vulcanimicrobiota bacterium]